MNPPLAIAPLEDLPEGSPSTALSPLSKNAQKRARKAALFAEHKLERRAREKEARKEKKRLRGERIAAGEQVSEDDRSSKRAKLNGPQKPFRARVVVDLGFDEKMSDKEITSLCSQLAYTYSTNRRSQTPFHTLLFTSLNGRTLTRLESMNDAGYKRWTATEWWTGSYERLWQDTREITDSNTAAVSTNDVHGDGENRVEPAAAASKDNIIYLTADSSEELSELKEGETYIIGGICDHNRYKNLCLEKAVGSGIRAAQLPIGHYLSHLPTRKVLTVNQVFEVLVKWVETKDWEHAFYSVIPKRKFQSGGAQDVDHGDECNNLNNQEGDMAEEHDKGELQEV